jgi:hypothetical protein
VTDPGRFPVRRQFGLGKCRQHPNRRGDHTGQGGEKTVRDTDRDFIMTSFRPAFVLVAPCSQGHRAGNNRRPSPTAASAACTMTARKDVPCAGGGMDAAVVKDLLEFVTEVAAATAALLQLWELFGRWRQRNRDDQAGPTAAR